MKKPEVQLLPLSVLWKQYKEKNIKGKATMEDVREEVNELIRRIGIIAEKEKGEND